MSVAIAMTIGNASAQVASTSKKGSLLVYPVINVESGSDTMIEISNDYTTTVHVECKYINEWKGRVDFDFNLTAKQTASWTVGALSGDQVTPPPFPSDGRYPSFGSNKRGELICYAVSPDLINQVAFNHLHGNAIVTVGGSSFRYNPWAFQALDAAGAPSAAVNVPVGVPGKILLQGLPNTYDACPAYNVTTFMPNGAVLPPLTARANYYNFSSCNQDLRQDYSVYRTKLQFEKVWNSNEQGFSGAYSCADSIGSVILSANPKVTQGSNFDYATLRTANARFQVQGVKSTQCRASVPAGLLGVHWQAVQTGATTTLVGSNMHGAGRMTGFVLWDPVVGSVPLGPASAK